MQLLKTMALSRSDDQRAMLDVILEGGQRAAETIANIKNIGQDKPTREVKRMSPEIKFEPNYEPPTPPKPPKDAKPLVDNALEGLYSDLTMVRKKMDAFFDDGQMSQEEINEIIIDMFGIQTKLYSIIKKK